MFGMIWAGVLIFLILLCMEGLIVGYRKVFHLPKPDFTLILDEDIILDHEITDEYLTPTRLPKEPCELQVTGKEPCEFRRTRWT
jgi:hypothetical protein